MDKGEVLQAGPTSEVYRRPATLFVADFIGSPSMNFLPAAGPLAPGASEVRVNGATIGVPRLREGLEGAEAVLGARPEHIRLADEGALRGRVFGVEYTGTRQIVVVDSDAGRLRVRAPNSLRVELGETVGLDFQHDSLVVFDRRSERALDSDLMAGDGRG
jgi:multiple sugar transport system ATP-binding protein